MSNSFICPCGETRVQQLLTSHLCANPSCENYDEGFAKEIEPEKVIEEEPLITPISLTFTTSAGNFNAVSIGSNVTLGSDVYMGTYASNNYSFNYIDPLEEKIKDLEKTVASLQAELKTIASLKTELSKMKKTIKALEDLLKPYTADELF